jgi:uncharacterized protein YhfF
VSLERVPSAEPDPTVWRAFWAAFLEANPTYRGREPADVFAFGDHRAIADELAELVRRGVKRGTTTSLEAMRRELAASPEPGALSIVLRGDGTPVCVIETVETFRTTFGEVDAAFAADEGEGDGSLAHWREAHEDFFGREAESLGYAFTPGLEVECERFRVVWPAPS